jgi:carbon monoxide dehydrogenase subunit G
MQTDHDAGRLVRAATLLGLALLAVALVRRYRRETRRLRVSASVRVDAPVDEVFAFMDDPENQRAITPAITDVRDVEPLENGGKRLGYTYSLGGVPLDGALETPVYEPDERVVFELSGALSGTITWTFEPTEAGTQVTYAAAYDLPGSPLVGPFRPLARRYNERQLERTLENLRDRFA